MSSFLDGETDELPEMEAEESPLAAPLDSPEPEPQEEEPSEDGAVNEPTQEGTSGRRSTRTVCERIHQPFLRVYSSRLSCMFSEILSQE